MKTRIITIFVLSILLLAAINPKAQFVTPLTTVSGQAEVTTVEGKSYSGKLKNTIFSSTGIMSFILIDTTADDIKFKAEEVKQLKLEVDGLAKLEIGAKQSLNNSKFANSNYNEVDDRKYIYWQRVKNPDKDKYCLMQLLNPGFDDLIRVYDLPKAKSAEPSDDGVHGNIPTAYYVVKNGKTLKITKKKYKEQDFELLFGDCQQLIDNNEPEFEAFAEHVFYYNKRCK